eukprot:m51a1_g2829 hypothetical protein (586) ;mRNA; r:217233-219613
MAESFLYGVLRPAMVSIPADTDILSDPALIDRLLAAVDAAIAATRREAEQFAEAHRPDIEPAVAECKRLAREARDVGDAVASQERLLLDPSDGLLARAEALAAERSRLDAQIAEARQTLCCATEAQKIEADLLDFDLALSAGDLAGCASVLSDLESASLPRLSSLCSGASSQPVSAGASAAVLSRRQRLREAAVSLAASCVAPGAAPASVRVDAGALARASAVLGPEALLDAAAPAVLAGIEQGVLDFDNSVGALLPGASAALVPCADGLEQRTCAYLQAEMLSWARSLACPECPGGAPAAPRSAAVLACVRWALDQRAACEGAAPGIAAALGDACVAAVDVYAAASRHCGARAAAEVPHIAAVALCDLVALSHALAAEALARALPRGLGVSLASRAAFLADCAARDLEAEVARRAATVTEPLASVDGGLGGLYAEPKWKAVDQALSQSCHTLRRLAPVWRDALPRRSCDAAVRALVGRVAEFAVGCVGGMRDISEAESHLIAELLGRLHECFADVAGPEAMGSCASWRRLVRLQELMDMRLAKIAELHATGELSEFSDEELAGLVVALFSDSEQRQALLRSLGR